MAVAGAEYDDGEVMPAAGSDFYYASLYFSPSRRHRLCVLEALRRELGRIPASVSDRGVAHIKLAWWRDEIARIGQAPPRHHLTRELALLSVDEPALPQIYAAFVEAIDASLVGQHFATRAEVLAMLVTQHGAVIEALCTDTGPISAAERAMLRELAAQIELGYELRRLREHRRAATVYLAAAELATHQLDLARVRETPNSAPLRDLLSAELSACRRALEQHLDTMARALRRRQRLLVTLARIQSRALQLTLDDGCRVLEQRVELTPVHKLWLAWRTHHFG